MRCVDAVCLVVNSDQLYEPERQLETIFVFASRNFKRGMRCEHLKAVGKALEAVFQLILQGDEWSETSVEAWNWIWRNISSCLSKELEALETGLCDVVITNWNTVKEQTDIETLGQRFWTQLNIEAPEQTHIFRRYTHTHTRARARTHARTRTHTHARTRTHTHTHAPPIQLGSTRHQRGW